MAGWPSFELVCSSNLLRWLAELVNSLSVLCWHAGRFLSEDGLLTEFELVN